MVEKTCSNCGRGKGHYRCGDCRAFYLDNWTPKDYSSKQKVTEDE